VIRRHVAVWAALIIAAGMPLTVAALYPRAIGDTCPALLGLAYLTTTALIHPRTRRGVS
jgi:hypothetical protein